jgi:hypothetical protein
VAWTRENRGATEPQKLPLSVLDVLLSVILLSLIWVASLWRVTRPGRRRGLLMIPPRNSDQRWDWIAVLIVIAPFVLLIDWIGDLFGN